MHVRTQSHTHVNYNGIWIPNDNKIRSGAIIGRNMVLKTRIELNEMLSCLSRKCRKVINLAAVDFVME